MCPDSDKKKKKKKKSPKQHTETGKKDRGGSAHANKCKVIRVNYAYNHIHVKPAYNK